MFGVEVVVCFDFIIVCWGFMIMIIVDCLIVSDLLCLDMCGTISLGFCVFD